VILMGGSWGSIVGVYVIHAWPERIAAYVGSPQVVNVPRSLTLNYQLALAAARDRQQQYRSPRCSRGTRASALCRRERLHAADAVQQCSGYSTQRRRSGCLRKGRTAAVHSAAARRDLHPEGRCAPRHAANEARCIRR
jgi:hypothetical protein